jgi:hypothetical protein
MPEGLSDDPPVGGKRMTSLRKATKNFAVEDGFMVFCDPACSIKSGVDSLSSADVTSEFHSIVRGVREQIEDRFPEEEHGFAHLFSIFQLSSVARQTAQSISTFGDYEVEQLVDTLSKPQATGREFYCKVPFIPPADKPEVRSVFSVHVCTLW